MGRSSTASSKSTARRTFSGAPHGSNAMKNAILTAVLFSAVVSAQEVKPETVGFSTERLARLHTLLQQKIEDKQLGGIVTVLARHGKVVDFRAYGKKDIAAGAAMDKEAIFRI